MTDLDRLGATLLEIHELPRKVPFEQFQESALQAVKQVLPFDSAWWGLVSGLDIHSVQRFGLPEGYRRHWEGVREHDAIAREVLAHPFKTSLFNQDRLAPYREINHFLAAYGIRHVICTTTRQRDLGLFAFLSLYRFEEPFSEEDRQKKQMLMPHLMHALGQSWRDSLEKSLLRNRGQSHICAAAVCDPRGLVLSSEAGLGSVLRREWPSWNGPRLPEKLEQALETRNRFVGIHISVEINAVSGLFLLRVSERDPIDDLTQREAQVAQLFAAGNSYKNVARKLALAPSTVRHYLRNVYGKLHVSDKASLATLLASAKLGQRGT